VVGFKLAQDKDQWRVLVNVVMNLGFHVGMEFIGVEWV
jgi:hypothetical protein